ncbi:hypothetical protein ACWJJH_15460 [Endozoicomonadaceae bacterium StTr2]
MPAPDKVDASGRYNTHGLLKGYFCANSIKGFIPAGVYYNTGVVNTLEGGLYIGADRRLVAEADTPARQLYLIS